MSRVFFFFPQKDFILPSQESEMHREGNKSSGQGNRVFAVCQNPEVDILEGLVLQLDCTFSDTTRLLLYVMVYNCCLSCSDRLDVDKGLKNCRLPKVMTNYRDECKIQSRDPSVAATKTASDDTNTTVNKFQRKME